jgi:MFS family permease
MLSLYSGVNAGARALGGVAVRRIRARSLLVLALLGNVVGMIALAYATTPSLAVMFAVFDGFAFGMALFATTALLIEHFGLKNSSALLGAVNLAATVAMLGPTIAGQTADRWGGFSPIFLIYAGAALVAAIIVAVTPAPRQPAN